MEPHPRRANAHPTIAKRDPIEVLEEIFQKRASSHVVTVAVEKQQVVIGKDPLRFTLRSSKPGHVYLLMVGSDSWHFFLLFPNSLDRENRIAAKKELKLPRSGWHTTAQDRPAEITSLQWFPNHRATSARRGSKNLELFAELPIVS